MCRFLLTIHLSLDKLCLSRRQRYATFYVYEYLKMSCDIIALLLLFIIVLDKSLPSAQRDSHLTPIKPNMLPTVRTEPNLDRRSDTLLVSL